MYIYIYILTYIYCTYIVLLLYLTTRKTEAVLNLSYNTLRKISSVLHTLKKASLTGEYEVLLAGKLVLKSMIHLSSL